MSLSATVGDAPLDKVKFITRGFGWAMLATLVVWNFNNILNLTFGWPSARPFIEAGFFSDGGWRSAFQFALYALGIGLAVGWVYCSQHISLRGDAARISNFNRYLVRGAFFAVLFVGLGDLVVSFLRVEGFLLPIVGEDLTRSLGRSQFRGPWLHIPLMILGMLVALRAKTLGFHWLTLLIVIAELAIVITRFVFSYEQAFMGDLVRFWYAALFLFSSAYTLLEEGHVRVDIFYAGMKNKTKGFINAVGSLLLGMTLCWTILVASLGGKSAIVYGTVRNFEISQSGFGLYVKYLMALFLVVFAITMLIQFVSYLMESVADVREEEGTRLNREVTMD
ncbi:MAG: TRAP transporter small permease subunit [Rhizobiaceae bacterium]